MPSEQTQADAYLATKVLTASPQELRLMLLDGAIKFCIQGRDGLANKNYEACFNGFNRCRAIIVELLSGMKPEPNPDLYEKLSSLYLYMISRLMQASHEKNVEKADEVIKLLTYERETWVIAMEKAAGERRGTAQPAAAPVAPKPAPAFAGSAGSFSFEG